MKLTVTVSSGDRKLLRSFALVITACSSTLQENEEYGSVKD